ncbi:MAG: LemA family protein [Burkholderiales bacterium]|nr:LemA family protein [Burkholderiales bacterium]
MRKLILIAAMLPLLTISGCGYNDLQQQDEVIKARWGHVLNQYQRRFDLIPNLVRVVKAYADHEREIMEEVAAARASIAASGSVSPNDPKKLESFVQAQDRLGKAVYRLLAVSENYPQLKADGVFQDLLAQLEGTENRITYARQKFIESIAQYNVTVRSFPSNLTAMYMGYTTKPNFSVESERTISTAPAVNLGK